MPVAGRPLSHWIVGTLRTAGAREIGQDFGPAAMGISSLGSLASPFAMGAKDQGAQTVAGQGAAARAGLASRGGLSSGAAERTAQGGANNYLNMTQGVNNTNTQNQMQIGMNDQQNKLSMMSQIPGMQLGAANFGLQKTNTALGARSTDVANQIQGAQAQNAFNLGTFQTNMAGYGAAQTANATKNASKK